MTVPSPCGCGEPDLTECFCSVQSTDDIVVSGGGNSASPWRFNFAPGATIDLSVTDTDTVDLTLVEETPGEYDLQADVNISTDGGNVVGQGTDGGLFVPDGTAAPAPITMRFRHRAPAQVIPVNEFTPVTFENLDNPGTPVNRITLPRAGVWLVSTTLVTRTFTDITWWQMWAGDADDFSDVYTSQSTVEFSADVNNNRSVTLTDFVTATGGQEFSIWTIHQSAQDLELQVDFELTRSTWKWLST